ncbi:MAG TPA: XdhC family protein, partial [Dongiaceae bacterium]|nr:XdhC family protein [Dongiaceae bacterium]
MKADTLARLLAERAAKRPVALATDLATGAQALVQDADVAGDLDLDAGTLAAARTRLAEDRSGVIEAGGRRLFLHVFNPPARLILIGAVHIAQALAPMAALAGYGVTVIDPRRAFASDARFPDVALIGDWPDEAMAALAPDRRTAVVTLTHDPKLDDPALQVALRSEAFYIGSLGSRKTHAARLERLRAAGFGDVELARIHGPVGLAIGAASPAEIAVSILAQITAARRG